jgi:putative peptidoglycan lipid II flippase
MALNFALTIPWAWLGFPGPHAGLAAATSIAGYLNAALLYLGLRRAQVLPHAGTLPRFVLRVGVACSVMAVLLIYFTPPVTAWMEVTRGTRIFWLAVAITGAAAAYFAALYAVGLRPSEFRMKSMSSPG